MLKREVLPRELLTKSEIEENAEEAQIRRNYLDAVLNFETLVKTWSEKIVNEVSKISNPATFSTTAVGQLLLETGTIKPDEVRRKFGKYVEEVILNQIAEYTQFLKNREDLLAKNRSLASDNFKLRKQLQALELEKKGGKWTKSATPSTTLNEPLWRLKVSSELRKRSPLFKFVELVAGTLVKSTASLLKINFEDSIFDMVKQSDTTEEDALELAFNAFLPQLDVGALRPVFAKCLMAAKETTENMFKVVRITPPKEEKLMELVEFAALVGVYVVQEEETSKVISSTRADKSQLDQTIYRCNLELRAALQKRGFRVNSTPADDARQMRRVF